MDLLIIGAGLSGAVVANKAAKAGKKVLVIERRPFIGGNIFDFKKDGVLVHKYGPHIFHTNDDLVYEFMSEFWDLNGFKNRVEASVKGHIIPIPFNFKGIDKFWPEESQEIKQKLIDRYGKDKRVGILDLLSQEDKQLKMVANFVYENVFVNYTSKMWGKSPDQIDKSVIARVPVVIGYGDRYFSDKYEGLPKKGYTSAIEKMLDHKNIDVRLSVDALQILDFKNSKVFLNDEEVTCPIIYCGPIDELFSYEFGELDYRSLDIQFETKNINKFQNTAVVNYPADPEMTRITEYKNMTLEDVDGITVISREYPGKYKRDSKRFGIPYYPMMTDQSRKQYERYQELISQYKNLIPLGRLATYRYLNMDVAVKYALEKWEEIKGGL